jgi:serine/threonine protein phosphatase PrpC
MKPAQSEWILNLTYAQGQYLGERAVQEDTADVQTLASNNGNLVAALADGMGGHTGGAVASQVAVKTFLEKFGSSNETAIPLRLGVALQEANKNISEQIRGDRQLEGMGCTLVGLFFDQHNLSWISVGDSPLFLYRDRRLLRLNEDHSMMPVLKNLESLGQLSQAEVAAHPQRNALRSALTGESFDLIDSSSKPFLLRPNDIVICASDGLLTLTETEILDVLNLTSKLSSNEICQALLKSVRKKDKPKQDNVTVQVFILNGQHSFAESRKINTKNVVTGFVFVFVFFIAFIIFLFSENSLDLKLFFAEKEGGTRSNQQDPRPIDIRSFSEINNLDQHFKENKSEKSLTDKGEKNKEINRPKIPDSVLKEQDDKDSINRSNKSNRSSNPNAFLDNERPNKNGTEDREIPSGRVAKPDIKMQIQVEPSKSDKQEKAVSTPNTSQIPAVVPGASQTFNPQAPSSAAPEPAGAVHTKRDSDVSTAHH